MANVSNFTIPLCLFFHPLSPYFFSSFFSPSLFTHVLQSRWINRRRFRAAVAQGPNPPSSNAAPTARFEQVFQGKGWQNSKPSPKLPRGSCQTESVWNKEVMRTSRPKRDLLPKPVALGQGRRAATWLQRSSLQVKASLQAFSGFDLKLPRAALSSHSSSCPF